MQSINCFDIGLMRRRSLAEWPQRAKNNSQNNMSDC